MVPGGGAVFTSQTIYCVYWGTILYPTLVKNLWLKVHQGGALTTVSAAEIGLFSSPTPPAGANQTLTKLIADGLGDLTGTAPAMVKQSGGTLNTSGYSLIPGTYLWMVTRIVAGGMGSISAVTNDIGMGMILQLASGSALTSITTIAGAIPAVPGSAPGLYATLD